MRPPALRNFVPEAKHAAAPRPPRFYQAQPKFGPAPISMFREADNNLTPHGSIPSANHGNASLPMREVNEHRERWNSRGDGRYFNRSTVAAVPPRALSGVGADLVERRNGGNWDPSQREFLVH